jgi:hypothetical protein
MLFKPSTKLLRWLGFIVLLLTVASVSVIQFDGPRQIAVAVLRSQSVSIALSRIQQFMIPANNAACLDELAKLDAVYTAQSGFTEGNQCIVEHAVRLTSASGMAIKNSPVLTCRMASELVKFTENTLQPVADQMFGSRIKAMSHLGTYNCRSMRQYPGIVSQHGFANAIDVAGFTLEDGTEINVADDWKGSSVKAVFLKEIADAGCEGFRVAVSPDSDANHWNHLHWDMGPYWSCR